MPLGSSDSRLSVDININSLRYDGRFLRHLSIPILTLFMILGSWMGPLVPLLCSLATEKSCQK